MNIENYLNLLNEKKIVIFLFHGVINKHENPVRNYNLKHLLASDFQQLISKLNERGNAIALDQLISPHNLIPSNSFVITFDDGFENNLSVAAPILKELNTPATFYITTDFIENNHMSWIDQIDYAVEETRETKIQLSFFNEIISLNSFNEKIELLKKIRKLSKESKIFFLEKEQHIQEIFHVTKVPFTKSLSTPIDKKMNWEEVNKLGSNSLFTIGGHTHTHPIMSYLNQENLDFEIDHCLNLLSRKGQLRNLTHFSYPEGQTYCYDQKVIDALKKRNILCCPTAIEGINNYNEDLFHLKRVTVI